MKHRIAVKLLWKITMLLPLVTLMACTPSAEDMLIGRWKQGYVIERMADETTGAVTFDTLPGYDTRVMVFMGDATCLSADRGDTVYYQWSLSGTTLVLWREGWAEDYTLNMLTKQRLVYSDSYSHYDSITGHRFNYKYRFEYTKL